MLRKAIWLGWMVLALCCLPLLAYGDYGHGDDCWWCIQDDFSLEEDASVWAYLTADITVLDVEMQTKVYLLDAPNGKKVRTGQYQGFLYGSTVSIHVLEEADGWALIEGYDMHNERLQGYVKSSLLKKVTPNLTYGIVVDKQTQRLHLYKEGVKLTEMLVSTGLNEPGKDYNETAAGEYLIGSWTGGFWSGNMFCDLGLRFNGGDLLHLVPCLIQADGTRNYDPFLKDLGQRASHGCIRVQLEPTEEGITMQWLWDNLKRGTKLIVWDDANRPMLYPEDDLALYYNPDNGRNFHANQYCSRVKDRYLPLAALTYAELRQEPFSTLTPCYGCTPPQSPLQIDEYNLSRGFAVPEVNTAQTIKVDESAPAALIVDSSGSSSVSLVTEEPAYVEDFQSFRTITLVTDEDSQEP